jgi:hypothetical protein
MTGFFAMGKRFTQWFLFLLFVGFFAACAAAPLLHPGAGHKVVFHTIGLIAFAAYGLALWPLSIWYNRSWATTFKSTVDALIYAVVTGLIFAWMWPAA